MEQNKIILSGIEYKITDTIDNVTIADSFVKSNKLQDTTGNGEARLYIGSQNSRNYALFFDQFRAKCFFTKEDLVKYLLEAETEYKLQEQKYRKDIKENFNSYSQYLAITHVDTLFFGINHALGEDRNRYYIRSDFDIWDFIRKIALPRISYMSLLRLKDKTGKIFIYFRLFIDYYFNKENHPKLIQKEIERIESSPLDEKLKSEIKRSRNGQGKYREALLHDMPACPFTGVTEDRLLIASHIKPWVICNNNEKIDPFNGLILTPTFDKLFDQGFITFTDDKKIIVSPYLSQMNSKRLFLVPRKIIEKIPIVGREKYLEYHRKNIFKG